MAAENLDISSSINSSAVQDNDDIRQQSCVRTQVSMGVEKRNCWRKFCTRVPAGKALYLVLLLNGIESFVFFEVLSGLSKTFFVYNKQSSDAMSEWSSLIVVDAVGKLIYPIAGLVADVWVGKKKVVYLSMWLLWASLVLFTVTALLEISMDNLYGYYIYYCIISFALVLFLIGIGGFETNIIPLGLDQLQGASAEELSSYFYWYYWSRQVGALIGTLSFFLLQSLITFDGISILQPFAATIVFSIGVILYGLFNRWLSEDSPSNNPLKLIARVTYHVITAKRGPPQHRRAFRYGEGIVPRIDLAKKDFDGIYENEEVENVKTFYQICMILLPYVFFAFVFGFISLSLDLWAFKLFFPYSNSGVHFITQNLAYVFNSFGLIVVIPTINFASSFVFSSSMYSRRSLRVKMGIGYVFLLLSSLSFITIRLNSPPSPLASLLLLLVPASLLCLSEMFAVITALEFMSAQSPQNTRGLLIGLFWFVFGLMNGFGQGIVIFFTQSYSLDTVRCVVEFVIFFAVVGLLVYVILAGCYKNRERPQPDEDDLNIRAYAASYYSFASHRSQ